MFIEVLTLAACAGAVYQARDGSTSPSARFGMYGLISLIAILVLL